MLVYQRVKGLFAGAPKRPKTHEDLRRKIGRVKSPLSSLQLTGPHVAT